MKPKPISSMQRPTPAASRSIRAPSASSRSAEPDSPVEERLPCLATMQPAPAAISAAVVETLKVRAPAAGAGGVEQVLAGGRHEGGEGAHRPRQPGELLDRLALHAQRDQEAGDLDVGGLAGHDLGERLGGVALAEVAGRRRDGRSRGSAARSSRALHEVREHLLAVLGEDRLGVELDALGRQLAVAHGHHDAAAGGADARARPAAS